MLGSVQSRYLTIFFFFLFRVPKHEKKLFFEKTCVLAVLSFPVHFAIKNYPDQNL